MKHNVIYLRPGWRRPVRQSGELGLTDLQAAIPRGWCSLCGAEVFGTGGLCERCGQEGAYDGEENEKSL